MRIDLDQLHVEPETYPGTQRIKPGTFDITLFLQDEFITQLPNTPIFVDDKLLFWEQHFDGKDFATYDNGHKKGGTLRYKSGHIRLPKYEILPVFESEEFKRGEKPRALVTLERVVIADAAGFTNEELLMDGFTSAKDVVSGMKTYYPDLTKNSLLSFYVFKEAQFNPKKRELKKYYEERELPFSW